MGDVVLREVGDNERMGHEQPSEGTFLDEMLGQWANAAERVKESATGEVAA